MAKVMKVLTLGKIEEGRFERKVNRKLGELQELICEFSKQHGPDLASKAKAKLVVTITLAPIKAGKDQQAYSVKAHAKTVPPEEPAYVTVAIEDFDADANGQRLFVSPSGSHADSPHQAKLCTDDGKPIDPATGEIREPAATTKKKD